jgi:CubicO group peptidase (beta-lactamase class C family)
MTTPLTQERLDRIVADAAAKKNIHGFVLHVRRGERRLTGAAGDLQASSRFYIASVTKSFVTAVLLKLEAAGKLDFGDRIAAHLPADLITGLHVKDGVDRSGEIEIRHLMSNTSGLPDYFDKETTARLVANHDEVWGLEPTLAAVRQKTPKFLPGQKAEYSDTNYQLLGAIIESVAGASLDAVFNEMIFGPLGLEDTYLYKGEADDRLVSMYYKERRLELPRYVASIGAEGGIVSTAADLGTFVEAFNGGALFDAARLEDLYRWRMIFAPGLFFYGIGIAKQPVSLLNLRKGLLGHWGQSGAFAFFDPESRTCLSGTANQFIGQNVAARAMIQTLRHPL